MTLVNQVGTKKTVDGEFSGVSGFQVVNDISEKKNDQLFIQWRYLGTVEIKQILRKSI